MTGTVQNYSFNTFGGTVSFQPPVPSGRKKVYHLIKHIPSYILISPKINKNKVKAIQF